MDINYKLVKKIIKKILKYFYLITMFDILHLLFS